MSLKLRQLPTWNLNDEVDLNRDVDNTYNLDDGAKLFFNDLFGVEHFMGHVKEGYRISDEYNLFDIPYLDKKDEFRYVSSQITWDSDVPSNSTMSVSISIDDGIFEEVSNGGEIPYSKGEDILNSTFKIKQKFITTDANVSPELYNLEIMIHTSIHDEYYMFTLKDNELYVNGINKGEQNIDFIEINEDKLKLKGLNRFDELMIKDIS